MLLLLLLLMLLLVVVAAVVVAAAVVVVVLRERLVSEVLLLFSDKDRFVPALYMNDLLCCWVFCLFLEKQQREQRRVSNLLFSVVVV
jgi:hypothetical protein